MTTGQPRTFPSVDLPPTRLLARGFTLIEMVVVITIIAILAGALLPVYVRPYIAEKRIETMFEMGQIEQAILGRWDYGDYGFLSTMGRLPNTTPLNALELMTSQGTSDPAVTIEPQTAIYGNDVPWGVPFGWTGPYLRYHQFPDPTADPWGNAYKITTTSSPTSGLWQIMSPGPDSSAGNTLDDIVYPSWGNGRNTAIYFQSQGSVIVEPVASYGGWEQPLTTLDIATSGVVIWYTTTTGVPTSSVCTVMLNTGTGNPFYQCWGPSTAPIPFGLHTIEIKMSPTSPKYAAFTSGFFEQNFVHERQVTYVKVVVPFANAPVTSAATLPAANNIPVAVYTVPTGGPADQITSGTVLQVRGKLQVGLLSVASTASTESSILQLNVTGVVTTPNQLNGLCSIWVQYSTDAFATSFNPPAAPIDALSAKTTWNNETGPIFIFSTWVGQPGIGTPMPASVPFTIPFVMPQPGNSLATTFRLAATAFPAGASCKLYQATMALTQTWGAQ